MFQRVFHSFININLCIDDELNLLPIITQLKHIARQQKQFDTIESDIFLGKNDKSLNELKTAIGAQAPIAQLVNVCKTLDQAKKIMLMIDVISIKVISVTSARGRGKSSAMGLAVADAVCYGYSNIIVKAPRITMFAVH